MDDLDQRPWWVTSDPNHPIHERDRLAAMSAVEPVPEPVVVVDPEPVPAEPEPDPSDVGGEP